MCYWLNFGANYIDCSLFSLFTCILDFTHRIQQKKLEHQSWQDCKLKLEKKKKLFGNSPIEIQQIYVISIGQMLEDYGLYN